MEEIQAAALAFYKNLSPELKTLSQNLFRALDTDENGSVSLQEFVDFMKEEGYEGSIASLFTELDKNGDGILDFEEVVTFYYIVIGRRMIFCDGCGNFMKGMFFTCVQCFDRADNTYDLCCECYSRKNDKVVQHDHDQFVDNYTMLQSKRLSSTPSPVVANPVEGNTSVPYQVPGDRYHVETAAKYNPVPQAQPAKEYCVDKTTRTSSGLKDHSDAKKERRKNNKKLIASTAVGVGAPYIINATLAVVAPSAAISANAAAAAANAALISAGAAVCSIM